MVKLSNSPYEATMLTLEARKSFALRVELFDRHDNEMSWEGLHGSFVLGKRGQTEPLIEVVGEEGVFALQANQLDMEPGTYQFVVVLNSNGYSLVIIKGEVRLLENVEAASTAYLYPASVPSETVAVKLDGMNVVRVHLRNTPLTLGIGGGGGGGTWDSIAGKPLTFPPSTHTHDQEDVGGLVAALAAIQSSLSNKANVGHLHSISHVGGLQDALNAKAAASHTHPLGGVDGLVSALDGKAALLHSHGITDVTGLQTALDNRAPIGHTHTVSQVAGLQSSLNAKADSGHTHLVSQVSGAIRSVNGYVPDINGNVAIPVGDPTGTVNWNGIVDKPETFPPSYHEHGLADVTDLQDELGSKAPLVHTHPMSDVTDLQDELDSKAPLVHTHPMSDVTDLQDELDSKAPLVHTHPMSDVTGLQNALDGKQPAGAYAASSHSHSWSQITSKPTTFPPSSHTHTIANTTGLQDALDGKAASAHTHTIANTTGLQDALDGKAASAHTHTVVQVTGLQGLLDGLAAALPSSVEVVDARSTFAGRGPDWYYANAGRAVRWDFVGVPEAGLPGNTGSSYAVIQTMVPGTTSGGGPVRQYAYAGNGSIFYRYGTSAAWSSHWVMVVEPALDTGWVSIPLSSGYSSGDPVVSGRRDGSRLEFRGELVTPASMAGNTWVTAGTIPEALRPTARIMLGTVGSGGATAKLSILANSADLRLWVSASGAHFIPLGGMIGERTVW